MSTIASMPPLARDNRLGFARGVAVSAPPKRGNSEPLRLAESGPQVGFERLTNDLGGGCVAARVVQELHGARQYLPNPFVELSDREIEVLRLIATGMSNSEIAEKLVISEKTVKSHVGNILDKLHVADRTQAAVYAWREGVVRR